jgi:hypothetical protein
MEQRFLSLFLGCQTLAKQNLAGVSRGFLVEILPANSAQNTGPTGRFKKVLQAQSLQRSVCQVRHAKGWRGGST